MTGGDLFCPKASLTSRIEIVSSNWGVVISAIRKIRGLFQEQLAEKAGISRSHLSAIEAPNMVRAFSMDIFFNIADALEVDPSDLIRGKMFPDDVLK